MSRLLNFICELLEYFGISSDLLIQLWRSKPYGQSRSIVRRIGSSLQLNHWPRVCFQLLAGLKEPDSCNYSHKPMVPSLADVRWIADDEGEVFTRFRNEIRPVKVEQMFSPMQEYCKPTISVNHLKSRNSTWNLGASNENALNKIYQLEDELTRLRSQIAMLVTMQDHRSDIPCTPVASVPPPKLTSTPFGTLYGPSKCAPPPPPPPPPMSTAENSARDLARECQAMKSNSSHVTIKPKPTENSSKPVSMMDVLKDMQNVKLRVVARSPGGTPMGKKPAINASVSDPAALIANALKRKFSHRYMNESSDNENEPFEFSPLSSPETSRFGQHLKLGKPNSLKTCKILKPADVNIGNYS
ncbi:mitochondrial fission regulator 2 [Scyliorhinus canicula]|uniref:mitochondrial fission regulator 2 n=1 Tax=Scyliorhinus canicula TaxID=7830 RepID=UPI0018F34D4F|nr:mitochondrial fission regulator 2 [Scyliorhinus canicula]